MLPELQFKSLDFYRINYSFEAQQITNGRSENIPQG